VTASATTLVLGRSNLARTIQLSLFAVAVVALAISALTTASLSARILFGILALVFGYTGWQVFSKGRFGHEIAGSVLKVRSAGVARDVPLQSIAGVGLIQTEMKSAIASYRAWEPFIWTSDRAGLRLRGITAFERKRSDFALMRTRPALVAHQIYQQAAAIQGPEGVLLRHEVQPMATAPPSIIELLPGSTTDEPKFQRWNPGTHWQPENT
jgi:hypothetical protein